ncbi:cell division protein [Romboutsia sp.]|uniref:cell division protein n=1 Tax=Romboutsia sp. TaxID=1965302 RepID=UPI003F402A78
METIQKMDVAKLIGIGDDGIKNLDAIKDQVKHNMDLEKIALNQDVDKDYVRQLLDGLDMLFLAYNSEDKRALQIVNAIGFMADERRILSIGLDSAKKENTDDVNLNSVIKINEENTDDLVNILNMMIDAISDFCTINMDLTDLKEAFASDKGIKYSYGEFNKGLTNEEIVKSLVEKAVQTSEELNAKKEIILVEMGLNYCESEAETLMYVNELLMEIQESREDTYEGIFTLYLKENLEDKMKVALIYN